MVIGLVLLTVFAVSAFVLRPVGEFGVIDSRIASAHEARRFSAQVWRGRDVANVQHNAVAEALSRELGNEVATDAAKLLFLSSLAIGPNALQGLTPEEIAALAVFLASERAASITGQTLNVDGGNVMS
mgnify:CR=1 FL=1